uniref:Uncharacterized protein n=1 Tax=Panagrolaimus superbus TaxID=310955 RepID=A0A914XWR7_9BILA
MGLINPPKKKKRRFDQVGEEAVKDVIKSKSRAEYEYENKIIDEYTAIKDAIKSKPKRSKFVELKNFLTDKKDNEEILLSLANHTDHEFISKLLITYSGTQTSSDLVIFDILKFYERTVKFNFKPLLPLVCGPNTESHYANLVKLGRAVHICPKPDEVLQGLNADILWETGINSSLFNPDDIEQKNPLHYDPRYQEQI